MISGEPGAISHVGHTEKIRSNFVAVSYGMAGRAASGKQVLSFLDPLTEIVTLLSTTLLSTLVAVVSLAVCP